MKQKIRIDAAKPSTVASRFGAMTGAFLAAMVLYWIGAVVGTVALTKGWLGQDTANIVGIAVASIVVPVCAYLYAAYLCKSIAQYQLRVTSHGFRINAMRSQQKNLNSRTTTSSA